MDPSGDPLRVQDKEWRTSLIGSDLAALHGLASNEKTKSTVETIVIQDEVDMLDPWTSPELPSTSRDYKIWSYDGLKAGLSELLLLLRDGQLRPREIRVVLHCMSDRNYQFSPEMRIAANLLESNERSGTARKHLQLACQTLVEAGELAVTSFTICFKPVSHFPILLTSKGHERPGASLTSPSVWEARMELSWSHGRVTGLPYLADADLSLGGLQVSYWLDKLLYTGARLERLSLSVSEPWVSGQPAASVMPHLTSLTVSHSTVTAGMLLHITAASSESLKHLTLFQVRLVGYPRWRGLLMDLADRLTVLESFTLQILREDLAGAHPIDWIKMSTDDVPEHCRQGLELHVKGPPTKKRVVDVTYSGSYASDVLRIVAQHGKSDRET